MVKKIIHTLGSRLLLLLLILLFFIPFILLVCLPKKWRFNRFVFFFVNIFYQSVLTLSFLPITFVGKSNIPDEPVIFAANHQSSLDIPLIGILAQGAPHVWLARHELMGSVILRWVLPALAVVINVLSPKKAVRGLMHAIELAEDGNKHLMIFPEGSRFTDGLVHDFFRGFVILAKRTGRPVVPVRIFGIHKAYPPNTFFMKYHPIKVVIGKPMRMQEGETDNEFKDRVHKWFVMQREGA